MDDQSRTYFTKVAIRYAEDWAFGHYDFEAYDSNGQWEGSVSASEVIERFTDWYIADCDEVWFDGEYPGQCSLPFKYDTWEKFLDKMGWRMS